MTPEELDEARAKEAERRWSSGDPNDPTIPDIATGAARQRLWYLSPRRHGKSAWIGLLREFHALQINNQETTR